VFEADGGFVGGAVYKNAVTIADVGTVPQAVYQTYREGSSFYYQFGAVPNGNYRVKLHFCELYFVKAGSRKFNVSIEGVPVLSNFDVFAQKGRRLAAVVKEFAVTVSDGNGMRLDFAGVTGKAIVNGIEIESSVPAILVTPTAVSVAEGGVAAFQVNLSQAPAATTTVAIARSGDTDISAAPTNLTFTVANWSTPQTVTLTAADDADTAAGTATFTCSASGLTAATVLATEADDDAPPYSGMRVNCAGPIAGVFAADSGFVGGAVYKNASPITDAGAVPQAVYQTYREGTTFYYQFGAVPNGNYKVKLHLCELYYVKAGSRKFNVSIEGVPVLSSFDVFAQKGKRFAAVVKEFAVTVSDGNGMRLDFAGIGGKAIVNGIEIEGAMPAVVVTPASVAVAEGGTATFQVKLSQEPASPATVTIVRSGDSDLSASPTNLTFVAADWSTPQTVTLTAADDADTTAGTATFTCSAVGHASAAVLATEVDNDAPLFSNHVNSGGPVAGVFAADSGFVGGVVYKNAATIADVGTVPQAVYQTYREGSTFYYQFGSVPNGSYKVKLHFCELYFVTANSRKFNVSIEGVPVLSSFDVFAQKGKRFAAVVREFEVTVSDGNGMRLDFAGVAGKAIVNGIEIESSADRQPVRAAEQTIAQVKPTKAEPAVVDVLTSGDAPGSSGWFAVDGDMSSAWVGNAHTNLWWLMLTYDPAVTARDVTTVMAEASATNVRYRYSMDGDEWQDLAPAIEAEPVSLKYLWLIFSETNAALQPVVIDVKPTE
jgi:NADH:ubiquinone oxidoreductase subunit E